MKAMHNNTLSNFSTRFLRAVELVKVARGYARDVNLDVCTENWAYPVMNFGGPGSPYYAEIWIDGMDWQNNYYLLEADMYDEVLEPSVMMIFHSHGEKDRCRHSHCQR